MDLFYLFRREPCIIGPYGCSRERYICLRQAILGKEKIKKTAQAILNARALYPNSSLADLYDPLTMPPELLKAHNANNRAVMEAYGFSTKMSEADCVAELMKMYQKSCQGKCAD